MEQCKAPARGQRAGLPRAFGGNVARFCRAGAQHDGRGYKTNDATSSEAPGYGVGVVLVIIAILVAVSGVVLNCVDEPGRLQVHSENPTPYGYTISLLLFFLPVTALGRWFLRHPEHRLAHKAYWKTVLALVPFGFLLDLVFGSFFFRFPNPEATLGIGIPALGGHIPLEEFLFYVGGFLAVLLCYIWADESWLSRYNVAEHEAAARCKYPLVQFHPASVVLGITMWMGAVIYKRQWAAEPGGFPWYFSYLVLVTVIPSAAFFRTAQPLINWRAFSFTLLFILLVSVIWEVTLAVPYGWWEYQPEAMMGLRIRAWSDLPVEAVGVWLVVTLDTVIAYEVIKILHRRRLLERAESGASIGRRKDVWLDGTHPGGAERDRVVSRRIPRPPGGAGMNL